jgi:hypothetical protein
MRSQAGSYGGLRGSRDAADGERYSQEKVAAVKEARDRSDKWVGIIRKGSVSSGLPTRLVTIIMPFRLLVLYSKLQSTQVYQTPDIPR